MKVGDYVRTRNGLIFKITSGNVDNWDLDISFDILESFEENWLELYKYNDNGSFFDNKNIISRQPEEINNNLAYREYFRYLPRIIYQMSSHSL